MHNEAILMNSTAGNFEKLPPRAHDAVRQERAYISPTLVVIGGACALPIDPGSEGRMLSIDRSDLNSPLLEPSVPRWSPTFFVEWTTVLLTLTGFSYDQAFQLIAGVSVLFSSLGDMLACWTSWWEAPRRQESVLGPTRRAADEDAPRTSRFSRDRRRRASGWHIPIFSKVLTR